MFIIEYYDSLSIEIKIILSILIVIIFIIIIILILNFLKKKSDYEIDSNLNIDKSSIEVNKNDSKIIITDKSKKVDESDKIIINDTKEQNLISELKDITLNSNLPGIVELDVVINTILKKFDPIITKKIEEKTSELISKVAFNMLNKLGIKIGEKGLERFGLKTSEKNKQKNTTVVALNTKPNNPFNESSFLALDILNQEEYDNISAKEQYTKIRDGIINEIKKIFKEHGLPYPFIVGPLDKLSYDDYTTKITEIVKDILNPINNSSFIKLMIDQIKLDIQNKELLYKDIDNDAKLKKYFNLLDLDKILDEAIKKLCITNNGKNILNPDGSYVCSYPDKKSCDSSYNWPLSKNDIYVEYKKNIYGNDDEIDACILSSSALHDICQTANIPYDTDSGVCNIDKDYCLSKGADWINENCNISEKINVAELLFGTTIVGRLKQVLDTNEYPKCRSGYIKNGLVCSKGSNVVSKDSYEQSAGIPNVQMIPKPNPSNDAENIVKNPVPNTTINSYEQRQPTGIPNVQMFPKPNPIYNLGNIVKNPSPTNTYNSNGGGISTVPFQTNSLPNTNSNKSNISTAVSVASSVANAVNLASGNRSSMSTAVSALSPSYSAMGPPSSNSSNRGFASALTSTARLFGSTKRR